MKKKVNIKISNTQDVEGLFKLLIPKEIKCFDIKKKEEGYIVRCSKASHSTCAYYILLNPNKKYIKSYSSFYKAKVENDVNIKLNKINFDFSGSNLTGISNILSLGGYFFVMFHFKTSRENQLKLRKYFLHIEQ